MAKFINPRTIAAGIGTVAGGIYGGATAETKDAYGYTLSNNDIFKNRALGILGGGAVGGFAGLGLKEAISPNKQIVREVLEVPRTTYRGEGVGRKEVFNSRPKVEIPVEPKAKSVAEPIAEPVAEPIAEPATRQRVAEPEMRQQQQRNTSYSYAPKYKESVGRQQASPPPPPPPPRQQKVKQEPFSWRRKPDPSKTASRAEERERKRRMREEEARRYQEQKQSRKQARAAKNKKLNPIETVEAELNAAIAQRNAVAAVESYKKLSTLLSTKPKNMTDSAFKTYRRSLLKKYHPDALRNTYPDMKFNDLNSFYNRYKAAEFSFMKNPYALGSSIGAGVGAVGGFLAPGKNKDGTDKTLGQRIGGAALGAGIGAGTGAGIVGLNKRFNKPVSPSSTSTTTTTTKPTGVVGTPPPAGKDPSQFTEAEKQFVKEQVNIGKQAEIGRAKNTVGDISQAPTRAAELEKKITAAQQNGDLAKAAELRTELFDFLNSAYQLDDGPNIKKLKRQYQTKWHPDKVGFKQYGNLYNFSNYV